MSTSSDSIAQVVVKFTSSTAAGSHPSSAPACRNLGSTCWPLQSSPSLTKRHKDLSFFGETIDRFEIRSLDIGAWLADGVMAAIMVYLTYGFPWCMGIHPWVIDTCIKNDDVYPSIVRQHLSAKGNWWEGRKILFLPVCYEGHWSLVWVNVVSQKIYHYDP